jgi:hypothetical protein
MADIVVGKRQKEMFTSDFFVEYIQARSEEKSVGLVIAELEKLSGRETLVTLEHKLKYQMKLTGGM